MDPRSEREKMLAGELYLASDPNLIAGRARAQQLTHRFNSSDLSLPQRADLIRDLFGQVGDNVQITPPFHCDYGSHIRVGNNFYMNFGCVILDCTWVEIGDNVLCAPYVQIYTAYHPTDPTLRLTGQELAAPIRIGNNVWIGGGAILCPGIQIGDNSVIGAGSVVTRQIPANVVAVGNPCRVLKSLESPQPGS
jgi:maltose O-acetyltransferase